MASPREVAGLLNALTEAFAHNSKPMTEGQVKVWIGALQDIPLPNLSAAVTQHICRSKFFPSIAEIRELAKPAEPTSPDDAWLQVQESLSGAWRDMQYPPATARVLRLMGGAFRLATMPVEGLVWERKRFLELYKDEADRMMLPANATAPQIEAPRD